MENTIRNFCRRLRGECFRIYLLLHGCRAGNGLKCSAFPRIRTTPKANIHIGKRVNLGYRLTLEAAATGSITIGDHTELTQDVLISSSKRVSIGRYVLVAERVSIRDTSHSMAANEKIILQSSVRDQVLIEDDVWIGANSIILQGVKLSKGTIIGANSTVTAGTVTEAYGIYAGSPLRRLGKRQ